MRGEGQSSHARTAEQQVGGVVVIVVVVVVVVVPMSYNKAFGNNNHIW